MSGLKHTLCVFFGVAFTATAINAQELRQGLSRQFNTLDPIYSTTIQSSEVTCPFFDTLVMYDPQKGVSPGLALTWDTNDAGDIYTFHLRQDSYWSDGVPVTAQDFVTTFQRLADPTRNEYSKPTYLIEVIKNANDVINGTRPVSELGVKALDDYTVQFELISAMSFFPSITTYCGLAATPTHQIAKHGETWAQQMPLTVGGPYKLTEKSDSKYVLERRPDHWDQDGPEKIVIYLYDHQDHVLRDFLVNKLDIAVGLGKNNADWVNSKNDLTVHKVTASATVYGVFNTKLKKFQNKNIRHALGQLIDHERISSQLDNKAASTFTPGTILFPHGNTHTTTFKSRTERMQIARQALKDAGYSAENPLSVKIMVTDEADFDRIGSAIESSWGIPEIKTEIDVTKRHSISARLEGNQYEFAIASWLADYPDPLTFLSVLKSGGPKNHSDWISPTYDRLLEKALVTPGRETRQALYVQMEDILKNESPIVPIFHPTWTIWTSDKIKRFGGGLGLVENRTVIMDD